MCRHRKHFHVFLHLLIQSSPNSPLLPSFPTLAFPSWKKKGISWMKEQQGKQEREGRRQVRTQLLQQLADSKTCLSSTGAFLDHQNKLINPTSVSKSIKEVNWSLAIIAEFLIALIADFLHLRGSLTSPQSPQKGILACQ